MLVLPSQLLGFLEAGVVIAKPGSSGEDCVFKSWEQLWVLHTSHSHPGFCTKAQHQQKAFPCSVAEIPRGVQRFPEVMRAECRPTKFSKL